MPVHLQGMDYSDNIDAEIGNLDFDAVCDDTSLNFDLTAESIADAVAANPSRALLRAVASGDRKEIIRRLDAGANANASNESKTTALHLAANGDAEMCKFRLSLGADPNLKDHNGDVPAAIAYRGNHTECLRCFVRATEDVDSGSAAPVNPPARSEPVIG